MNFSDMVQKYLNNDIVEIAVRPRHLDVRAVYRAISNIGQVKYSSRLIPYIYSSIPIRDVEKLRKDPAISEVNIVAPYEFQSISPAPIALATTQNTLNSDAVNSTKVNQLWKLGLTGKNIRIAVIDSGIDTTHPMFIDSNGISKIINAKSFSTESVDDIIGHGTFVSSCAAGYAWNTDIGILYGAALDAKLIIAKVSQGSYINGSLIIEAIDWLFSPESEGGAGGANIVQMSIGSFMITSDAIQAIQAIINNGALPVCSIGNSGPGSGTVSFPGGFGTAIGVGSNGLKTSDYNGAAVFSARGPGRNVCVKPDFLAPGGNQFIESRLEGSIGGDENIIAASPASIDSRRYKEWRGTSFSSPIVSGVMACLLERYDIKDIYSNIVKNNNSGFGAIDAVALNNLYSSASFSKHTKRFKINNYDPWIKMGATNPNPVYINNKLYIYYVNGDFRPTGVGLLIYDSINNSYTDYGTVLGAMTPPGIVYLNNKYYAFYANYDGTYHIYRSESTDGIVWTNPIYISDPDEHPFSIDAIVFNNNIFIYYDTITSVTPGKAAPIMYIMYDINSNTVLENGIALEPAVSPITDTHIVSTYYKPRCYIDSTSTGKVIMINTGTVMRPWYLTVSESTDGKNFILTNVQIPPLNKDYNYYNGYCMGTYFDNKYFFSNGTFLDAILGTELKLYVE